MNKSENRKNTKFKFLKVFLFILIMLLILLNFKYINKDRIPLIITIVLIAILGGSYFYFEKSNLGIKELVVIATLSSFAAVSRVPFYMIPNVQPATFLIALSGYVFGVYQGFLIGSLTAFISNIFLGQGPWTLWQMLAWGIIGSISGVLGKNKRPMSTYKFSILCFFYGFLFDWIMNLWHLIGFVKVINLKSILLTYAFGFSLDIMHGIGNYLFSIIFYERFLKILVRFKIRLRVSYIKEYIK